MDAGRYDNVAPITSATIELRQVRAFIAVAQELNFSRAAETLFITQPALSRQISALERLLGCALLVRSTRYVRLTPAGEVFLAKARDLVRDFDDAVAATRSIGGDNERQLDRVWGSFVDVSGTSGDIDDLRAAFDQLHAQFAVPPEVQTQPVNHGGVPCLALTPPDADDGVILLLHGGAYATGSAFGYQHLGAALALRAKLRVVIPEYRLAPEHPFPAAIEDVARAYASLLDLHGDAASIDLVGDSSGGGLVLSLLTWLAQKGMPSARRAVLMCPWIDLTEATELTGAEPPAVTAALEAAGLKQVYLAGHPATDPLVDPLRSDLSHLPPLLIQCATEDVACAEARALAERAREAGVDVTVDEYPLATHDFQIFWSMLPEAAAALDRAAAFLAHDAGSGSERIAAG
jgi:epsilon-lactone hydrolase